LDREVDAVYGNNFVEVADESFRPDGLVHGFFNPRDRPSLPAR
jgi:hypothetical protein